MTLLRGALRKILLRPATRITALVLAALLGLIYLGLATAVRTVPPSEGGDVVAEMFSFPGAVGVLAGLLATFGGLAGAGWAGAVAGGEWTWSTFRSAVARGESRARYALATLAAALVVALLGWLILFPLGLGAAAVAGIVTETPIGDPAAAVAAVPLVLLAGWLAVSMQAAIGFAVAFATRSSVAGIVAVVGTYFGEQFGAIVIPPDLLRLLPITAANNLVAEVGRGLSTDALLPVAVTLGYLLLAAAATALVARRAEIA